MSWAHRDSNDSEWQSFVEGNASGGGELVFGRITYEMMASYWPTPQAARDNPVVAEQMNNLPKVVFSRTLDKVSWNNTRLFNGDLASVVNRLKQEPGPGLVIFGSGTIISQVAQEGLIDEYQIVIIPLVLGKGRTMFDGIKERLALKLKQSRTFGNGNVMLDYKANG